MNGYIQIELGGQQRALKFNMHAIEMIGRNEVTTEHGNLTCFIYAGLCGNSFAKSAGSKPLCDESFEEVSEWAEDIIIEKKEDVKAEVLKAFAESKPMKRLAEQAEVAEAAKKKKK